MKKEIVEDLIMNLKDAGCDEELITQCIKKYNKYISILVRHNKKF